MIELERYGLPYHQCPDCEYGAFDAGYVQAHIDGLAHRPPPPPGAERGEAEPEPTPEPTPAPRRPRRSPK